MQIRKNFLPRHPLTILKFFVIITMLCIVYWFEMAIVLPRTFAYGTFLYNFHFILGHFVGINVFGNYFATILCETGIGLIKNPTNTNSNWRKCSKCKILAPPRSWHCQHCNTCILKRDHHCNFTNCCIGHLNFRYFYYFSFYIFFAVFYSSSFNFYFIYKNFNLKSLLNPMYVCMPYVVLIDIMKGKWTEEEQEYLAYMLLIFIEISFGLLGIYMWYTHSKQMWRGMVTYEWDQKIEKYDLGWKENLENALGKRWYLTWICPFLESKLTSDGIEWKENEKQ